MSVVFLQPRHFYQIFFPVAGQRRSERTSGKSEFLSGSARRGAFGVARPAAPAFRSGSVLGCRGRAPGQRARSGGLRDLSFRDFTRPANGGYPRSVLGAARRRRRAERFIARRRSGDRSRPFGGGGSTDHARGPSSPYGPARRPVDQRRPGKNRSRFQPGRSRLFIPRRPSVADRLAHQASVVVTPS